MTPKQNLCETCSGLAQSGALICKSSARRLSAAEPLLAGLNGLDRVWSSAPSEGGGAGSRQCPQVRACSVCGHADGQTNRVLGASAHALRDDHPRPAMSGGERQVRRILHPAGELAEALSTRIGAPLSLCLGSEKTGVYAATSTVPRNILLVDDVLDEGDALRLCARVLRAAGAARVVAITFARERPSRTG